MVNYLEQKNIETQILQFDMEIQQTKVHFISTKLLVSAFPFTMWRFSDDCWIAQRHPVFGSLSYHQLSSV